MTRDIEAATEVSHSLVREVLGLCEMLRGPDAESMVVAISELEKIGAHAIPVMSKLMRIADDSMLLQGSTAVSIIAQSEIDDHLPFQMDRDECYEALCDYMSDLSRNSSTTIRRFAVQSLGAIMKEIAVEPLVRSLADTSPQVRADAAIALQLCVKTKDDRSAIGPLLNMLEDDDASVRLAAIKALGRLAPNELTRTLEAHSQGAAPEGIARIGEAAVFELIDELRAFQRVGEICRAEKCSEFTFIKMAEALALTPESLRRYLECVSRFFRFYYKQYEGLDVAEDNDQMVSREHKLLDRGQGRRRTIICAQGWKAWEETCRYLDTRDGKARALSSKQSKVQANTLMDGSPSIEELNAEHMCTGLYLISGRLVDEHPGGLVVLLGGDTDAGGQTIRADSNGLFYRLIEISNSGVVTAQAMNSLGIKTKTEQVAILCPSQARSTEVPQ